MTYAKPERWKDPAYKLFPCQVGFNAPPHDFDAAPANFMIIARERAGPVNAVVVNGMPNFRRAGGLLSPEGVPA